MLETDNALESFYAACAAAGPSRCALHANTSALIRARVDALTAAVHLRPVRVFNGTDPSTPAFGIVDYSLVTQQLFDGLYFPFATGAQTAEALVALERGDGAPLFAGSAEAAVDGLDTCRFAQPFVAQLLDTATPIVCGDSAGRGLKTFEETRGALDVLVRQSSFGNNWFNLLPGPCS